jgi:hypothetical protein
MLSRALISATVALLIGGFAAEPAPVQAQNLEAGKSPSQIFAGSCTACHTGARGLLKTVPAGSLTGFLRQHYTTSPEMAGLLSAFLISNGASDARYGGRQPKAGKPGEVPPEQLDRQGRRLRGVTTSQEIANPGAESQQGTKPDSAGRRARNAKRLARPADEAAKPAEGEAPAAAVSERGPDGRKPTARHRLGRQGKPGVEEPSKESSKGDAARAGSSKGEPPGEEKPAAESAKDEGAKSDGAKPSAEGAPEAVKSEAPKEAGNPVPPVTPAPTRQSVPAAASSAPEPASGPSTSAAPSAPAVAVPAAVDSTPPPSAPVAPGSSAPPTSK